VAKESPSRTLPKKAVLDDTGRHEINMNASGATKDTDSHGLGGIYAACRMRCIRENKK